MSGIVPHNIYNSHPQEQQEQQQHQQQLHPQHPQNNQETIQNIVYIQADPFGEQLNINSSPLQDIYASSSSSLASASVSSPTASSSSITPTTAKVANRYQAILENLLQLRDDVVTESIRTAIKLIVKHRRNSDSTDWLRVIFKSLEILLSKINVQNISLNVNLFINISNLNLHINLRLISSYCQIYLSFMHLFVNSHLKVYRSLSI